MSRKRVRVERGQVTKLILDEPDKANAMSPEMADDFYEAVEAIRADDAARVVILTGEGKQFSGGGRLEMLEELVANDWNRNRDYMLHFYKRYMSLFELDIPVIAAINGAAVGAGLLIAMTADIRIASESAKMGVNFVKLGLHPGLGGTFTLPLLLGYAQEAELLYTGKLVKGEEALRLGLVNQVVPAERLAAAADEMAAEIATNAPKTIRVLKRNMKSRLLRELQSALNDEAAAQASAGAELQKGLAAAKSRRTAEF